MRNIYIAMILMAFLSGCTPYTGAYRKFYDSKVPVTPKPVKDRKSFVFAYTIPPDANLSHDIHELKKMIADNYEIVGEAAFTGDFQNPHAARKMLKSKGATLLLVGTKKIGSRDVVRSSSTGSSIDWGFVITGQQSGISSNNSSANTWTDEIGQYDHYGLFLRPQSSKKDAWELTIKDLIDTIELNSVKYIQNDNLILAIYERKDKDDKLVFYYKNKKMINKDAQYSYYTLPQQHGQKIRRGDLVANIKGTKWTAFLKMPVDATIEYTDRGFMRVVYTGYDVFYSEVKGDDLNSIYPLIRAESETK